MARDRTAGARERVAALRDEGDSAALRRELAGHLDARSGAVVAAAARAIAERGIQSLETELAESFARLLDAAANGEPQCLGKRALAKALVDLKCTASALDVYRAGLRCVQLEPVFGGKVDTAAELRAICAHGLVLAGPGDLWAALAELLADPEPAARAGAVRAIAFAGNAYVGVPLLRLRVRCGDPDPRIVADCFSALLTLDVEGSLGFVAEHLQGADAAVAEGAALALGESRAAAALDHLCSWLERCFVPELQSAAYTAIALLRSDAATEFLLGEIASANERRACEVIAVLAMHRGDDKLRTRIAKAVASRSERALREVFQQTFGPLPE
jgi:hypothetical protein